MDGSSFVFNRPYSSRRPKSVFSIGLVCSLVAIVKGGRRQGRQKKRLEDNVRKMDRPGVRRVPEGSGEQRKMEETGCEIICGALMTLVVQGQVR